MLKPCHWKFQGVVLSTSMINVLVLTSKLSGLATAQDCATLWQVLDERCPDVMTLPHKLKESCAYSCTTTPWPNLSNPGAVRRWQYREGKKPAEQGSGEAVYGHAGIRSHLLKDMRSVLAGMVSLQHHRCVY